MKDQVFVKITNQMIYQKICELEDHVKTTNGKVKLNRWIGTTALSMVTAIILLLLAI